MIGILLTAAGAWLLHLEPGLGFARLATAPFREPGSRRMIVVALIWGTTSSLDKVAIAHGSEALLGFWLSAGSALCLVCLRALFPRLGDVSATESRDRAPTRAWSEPLLYGAAVISAVAVLCQFWAYRELMVAYVETIKRAGGLLSALAGTMFFGETGSWFRLPAAALMVIGVFLLAW
jgi:drug/metabolite transporter (DMT)-like permease